MAQVKRQPTVKLMLRLPSNLHKMLRKAAEAKVPPNSLNREIVDRLVSTFELGKTHSELGKLDEFFASFKRQVLAKWEEALNEAEERKVLADKEGGRGERRREP
jgi:hypothetical protein